MKIYFVKYLLLATVCCLFAGAANAQKKPVRHSTTRKTTKARTQATVTPTVAVTDTVKPVVVAPVERVPDSLPIKKVLKSLRTDEAVTGGNDIRDRTPLPYENLRIDDAMYRHKIWREIDTREKINLPFRYAADQDNGNQRFISILLQAIQDSAVTVFNNIDDRFTTPMTIGQVATALSGDSVPVPQFNEKGEQTGVIYKRAEVNLDSITKFHIKEEVIFDKESSRLFWRILGIAPVKRVVTSMGIDLGESELFWVYYPDMRPIFAKYEIYNGKNFGARMTWEELFESRMFYGRIIKSTIENPYDQLLKNVPGLRDNTILQLLEGENIKEKIFNYEQDLWSY